MIHTHKYQIHYFGQPWEIGRRHRFLSYKKRFCNRLPFSKSVGHFVFLFWLNKWIIYAVNRHQESALQPVACSTHISPLFQAFYDITIAPTSQCKYDIVIRMCLVLLSLLLWSRWKEGTTNMDTLPTPQQKSLNFYSFLVARHADCYGIKGNQYSSHKYLCWTPLNIFYYI